MKEGSSSGPERTREQEKPRRERRITKTCHWLIWFHVGLPFLEMFLRPPRPCSPVTCISSQSLCQSGNYHESLCLSTKAQQKLFTFFFRAWSQNYPLNVTPALEIAEQREDDLYISRLCKTQMCVNRLDGNTCNFRPLHVGPYASITVSFFLPIQ